MGISLFCELLLKNAVKPLNSFMNESRVVRSIPDLHRHGAKTLRRVPARTVFYRYPSVNILQPELQVTRYTQVKLRAGEVRYPLRLGSG